MLKILLFFASVFFLGCASNPKISLSDILDKEQCPAGSFKGWGIAEDETAAIDIARAGVASEIQSAISVQSEYLNEVVNEEDKSSFKKQINRSYSIENASDAKVKFKERQEKEIGVVACMSRADAAKGFLEKQRLLSDSLELAFNAALKTKHPKHKNDAWQRTQMLWNELARIQGLLKGWGVAKEDYINSASETYSKAKEDYKGYCQSAKLHWNPERESEYSEIAFSKLSSGIKMEKSPCSDRGISLVCKGAEPECVFKYGLENCSYGQSLSLVSCDGTEYLRLSNDVAGSHQKLEMAVEKLRNNLKSADFWNKWIEEIKQWSPQCR